jgi:hypothetical protein
MDDDISYSPLSRTVNYTDPRYDKFDTVSEDPYGSDKIHKHGYATLVAKEYGTCDPPKVMKLYFSNKNIKRIQEKLKSEVYSRSYKKFMLDEDQDVLDLVTSMRAVYRMYAKSLPVAIVRQVKVLNEQTVQYVAPGIMENLKQHYDYLRDIKNPIRPLPDPINVNQAGRGQLRGVAHVLNI